MRLRAHGVRLAAMVVVTGFALAAGVAGAALVTVNSTQNTALGKILISSSGKTLYHYSSEAKNAVKCTGACASTWPPLVVAKGGKPIAGPGVTASLLGTVARPDGKLQVTYRGMPLYLYSADKKAGDVKGQGLGGTWHALTPAGKIVTKSVSTGSSTGKVSGSTSGSGSSSGGSSSGGTSSGGTSGGTSSGGSSGGGGGGSAPPTDCATNPGGYGCM